MHSNSKQWRAGLALGAALLFVLPVTGSASEVEIKTKPELNETEYCLAKQECRICWTTYQTEINQGIYHVRNRCGLTLEVQLPLLKKLLTRIDANEKNGPAFHTLFWGGLAPAPGQGGSQMSMRLALAAFRSTGWDKSKGRPVKGHSNPYVRDLANAARIFPELQQLFNATGRRIAVSSVEKVMVMPAAKLPFYDQLKAHGVLPDHRLPFDGLTWFGISAE